MKTAISHIIPVAGFLLAMPLLPAQAWAEGPPRQETKKELRVIATTDGHGDAGQKIERHIKFIGGGPQEMETVTYLGVMTKPMDETLAEQFSLQKNTGLIVVQVMDKSPAAAVLKRHDLLLKFNDQILIDQRQLGVLVRNAKEGEEVTLSYIRAGKPGTVKVRLGQHEVPKMAMFHQAAPAAEGHGMQWVTSAAAMAPRAEVDRLLGLIDLGKGGAPRVVRHNQLDGDRTVTVVVNTGNSNLSFNDEKGSLELTVKDGQKELVAKDAKGETIFAGPINTPEERKGLPPEVAERLGKIEHMQGFSFKTGDDFEGGEVKVVRPLGRGIAYPQPVPAPAVRPRQAL